MPDVTPAVTPAPIVPAVQPGNPDPLAAPPTPEPGAQAPVIDPAAAPVPPVVPVEPVPPVVPPVEPEPQNVYVPSHPDPQVQTVEAMLAEKKCTPEQVAEVFSKSVASGNLADVDVPKLTALLGDAGAKLAMAALGQYDMKVKAESKKLQDTATHLLGGQEQFEAFKTWLGTQTTGELAADINEYKFAVQRGGKLAYLALDALKNLYHQHAGVPVGQQNIVQPDVPGSPGTTLLPFNNRREYVNAMKEARDKKDDAAVAMVTRRFMVKPV